MFLCLDKHKLYLNFHYIVYLFYFVLDGIWMKLATFWATSELTMKKAILVSIHSVVTRLSFLIQR